MRNKIINNELATITRTKKYNIQKHNDIPILIPYIQERKTDTFKEYITIDGEIETIQLQHKTIDNVLLFSRGGFF